MKVSNDMQHANSYHARSEICENHDGIVSQHKTTQQTKFSENGKNINHKKLKKSE